MPLEQCLAGRRSVRKLAGDPLPLTAVSQLLWAGQGITSRSGLRTAPSAGALYPLLLYAVAGRITELEAGIYRYIPGEHILEAVLAGDLLEDLCAAALGQGAIRRSALCLVLTAVYERTTGKYGRRGVQYVHLDAGHAAQNICLQATALGLGTVPIGAFDDDRVKSTLRLPAEEAPLYILPVGKY
jgi:SagB-type dehydrogenase family enzyme